VLRGLLEIFLEEVRGRIPRLVRIEDFDVEIEGALVVILLEPLCCSWRFARRWIRRISASGYGWLDID
jgi:hypothetical protein